MTCLEGRSSGWPAGLWVSGLACLVLLTLSGCQESGPLEGTGSRSAAEDGAPAPAQPTGRDEPGAKARVNPASLRVEIDTNLPTDRAQRKCEEVCSQIDPHNDGWGTEVLSGAIDNQLKAVGKVIVHPGQPGVPDARHLAAADYLSGPLRPRELTAVWQAQGLTVRRPPAIDPRQAGAVVASASTHNNLMTHQGPAGFAEALQELGTGLRGARDVWVKFKLFRLNDARPAVVTRAYYQAAGRTAQGMVQQNATWRCRWRIEMNDQGEEVPRLVQIDVADYEESVSMTPPVFSDCTRTALANEPSFDAQLQHGLNYWVERIDRSYRGGITERYGLALGDVNGDDLEDVFVCQPVGIPKRLLVQQPDGTYLDRAAAAGVDFLDHVASALFVDLDNDGDQDLVLCTLYRVLFLANDGQGRFALRREQPIKEWDVHALSASDFDGDGDLDVLLTVGTGASGRPRGAYFDARHGGGIFLFRNDIAANPKIPANKPWTFTDVTEAVGLGKDNFRVALAAAWEDYDDDDDPDLYVANDFGPNDLFRNDGGKFVNVAIEARVEDFGSGMSVSWGDFNRDGRIDLYVGNMFSSAGNRITFQTDKLRSLDRSLPLLQRFAKGNSLFENLGSGRFREVGDPLGVEMARWAWSSLFTDINNDGWEDLVVANGYVSNDNPDDL
jgi:hypothetical protein